jgi:Raf kinase inhibitor-like YbhB/YbcL family protein
MYLKSNSFEKGRQIPKKYSCQVENISPPLNWGNIPEGTKSLMLFVFDKDVPTSFLHLTTIDHWVVYNIPPKITELQEGVPKGDRLENGAFQGKNTKNDLSYTGSCPPFGGHEYHFELYALSKNLEIKSEEATRNNLIKLAKGNVIETTELKVKYRHQ